MQRLNSVDPQVATGRTKELLDTVQQAFGMVPNTARVMANSPAALESFLVFSTAMSGTKIDKKLHNQLKLTTSETNSCSYCTSILSAVAPSAGLTAEDILAGRTGHSEDRHTKAALAFANDVLESRGKVSEKQLAAVRDAGFGDAEIVEIVASVVLGCFTNFLNNVADTDLDIPKAEPIDSRAASTCGTEASPGFLRKVDEKTVGFADFGGNRQYITLGNLSENPRAFIFLMDYVRSRRIKLWGTIRVVEDDPALIDRLRDPSYPGKVERAILFRIEAWDVNCPQHIHKRFPQKQVAPVIEQLQAKIAELEARLTTWESKEKDS